jgi:hypothetical protein
LVAEVGRLPENLQASDDVTPLRNPTEFRYDFAILFSYL